MPWRAQTSAAPFLSRGWEHGTAPLRGGARRRFDGVSMELLGPIGPYRILYIYNIFIILYHILYIGLLS